MSWTKGDRVTWKDATGGHRTGEYQWYEPDRKYAVVLDKQRLEVVRVALTDLALLPRRED